MEHNDDGVHPVDEDRSLDAELVEQCRTGDADAFGRLYDRWLDRVVDLSRRIVGDDGAALDVAQDTFLKAHQSIDDLRDAQAFGGWLLRIARNKALDRQREDRRAAPVDGEVMDVIESSGAAAATGSSSLDVFDRLDRLERPEDVANDKEVAALVWGAATSLGERDATVLDLQLRHGMSPAEIGEVMGVNRNAANQLVHRLRGRLERAIASRVLWRDGRPDCAELADALDVAGVHAFDQDAVRVASRHADDCERCERRRKALLAPSALFSSLPIVAVADFDARRIASGLDEQGVSMSGSAHHPAEADRWWRRRSAQLAGVVAAALALILGGWLLTGANESAEQPPSAVAAASTVAVSTTIESTTTTAPDNVIITVTTAPPADAGPAAPAPDIATDPDPPAPPPPASPAVVTASVSPQSVPDVYPMTAGSAPTVSWSVTNAVAATASGPGLASSSPSGSQLVCPGTINSSLCQATPGTYSYTITGTNTAGQTTQQVVSFTVA